MEIYVIKWLDTGEISSRGFKDKAAAIHFILTNYIEEENVLTADVIDSLFDGEYIADYAAYYKVFID